MDADFRREQLKKLPAKALKRIVLPELDREYTLSEIAIITSAGPARALGLPHKGHLGIGADADVAIYNEDARTWPACSPIRATSSRAARWSSRRARFARRRGPRVHRAARLRREDRGLSSVRCSSRYYTMSFDNYPVEMERIGHAGNSRLRDVARG